MSWKVIVWCTDCGNGQDPMGCFDGGSEVVGIFPTEAEASAFAGARRIEHGSPWQHDVEPTQTGSEAP